MAHVRLEAMLLIQGGHQGGNRRRSISADWICF